MVHASLSVEGRLSSGLAALKCSHRDFGEICACMNVPVSHSLISSVFRGEREFSEWTGEQLLSVFAELVALKGYLHDAPLNFGATEGLSTLLVQRRLALAMADEDAEAAVAAKG